MKSRHRSLSSRVALEMTEKISSGEYAVGDQIPVESQLMLSYNVSRSVVREAIALLRSEGLLLSRQGKGVFVASKEKSVLKINADKLGEITEIIDILELRLGVEVESAGLAAARQDKTAIAHVLSVLEKAENIDDFVRNPRQLDFDFHMAIALASGNSYMPKFLDFIGMVIIPPSQLIHNWQPMLSRDYLSRMHDEHKNIAEAINKGDIEASRQAMRLHLTESLKRYKALR
ncbi:FadR/GntR family transcriptional regulator [Halomonas dongshanensis]|uniref:FadR family transcriptional regulator n=1 Tax=Halomonas dongshanensis TaxID=2890835 RepID=A0ABT2EBI0_9GAMM|nr:FadR/GntR family transcriptional regulator [Halomonas dongshanensis]MCS2608002.1 FadR family transcriptional regulator [Halomonas dongshanensis]